MSVWSGGERLIPLVSTVVTRGGTRIDFSLSLNPNLYEGNTRVILGKLLQLVKLLYTRVYLYSYGYVDQIGHTSVAHLRAQTWTHY